MCAPYLIWVRLLHACKVMYTWERDYVLCVCMCTCVCLCYMYVWTMCVLYQYT
jgi:hypothetical protein